MKPPTGDTRTPPRYRWQFSLKSLLLAFAIAAVPLGLLAYLLDFYRQQPLVKIDVQYDGASATVLDDAVRRPIFDQLFVLERAAMVRSVSSPGKLEIYVRAFPGTRNDEFLNAVQQAVALTEVLLPSEAAVNGVKLLPSATEIPDVTNTEATLLQFTIDRDRAKQLGFAMADVFGQIKQIQQQFDQGKLSPLHLSEATLTNDAGQNVPLVEIVDVTMEDQPTRIVRQSFTKE